jgi:geranylgeranyl diphosphate synthase type I
MIKRIATIKMDQFKHYRKIIKKELEIFISVKKKQFAPNHSEAIRLLEEFTQTGKMIRGSLFLLIALKGESPPFIDEQLVWGALALELVQAGFLIHDDIMDQSKVRRGALSLHYLYSEMLEKNLSKEEKIHHGESLALCVGDLSFFLAQELLIKAFSEKPFCKEALGFLSYEWSNVCLNQMDDIFLGLKEFEDEELYESIFKLYEGKTARYTFSLPLKLGAFCINESSEVKEVLFDLGVFMGILFQIQDDYIDLFDSKENSGKSEGKDILEGKKTLYLYLLFKELSVKEKQYFLTLTQQKNLLKEDLMKIRSLLQEKKVLYKVQHIKDELANKIKALFEKEILPFWLESLCKEFLAYYILK